ncbi:hypothetical protein GCM10022204_36280 [Microlunatus aurantiacus]|uniref:Uncharacterized protein n=1 Tax=Microlunatus aurantiacus TaxID=446786 RepID=A0ABP7E915_9ACTN
MTVSLDPRLAEKQKDNVIDHRRLVRSHRQDLPEIRNCQWAVAPGPGLHRPVQPVREPV